MQDNDDRKETRREVSRGRGIESAAALWSQDPAARTARSTAVVQYLERK